MNSSKDESRLLPPLEGAVARGRGAEQIAALWLRLRGLTLLDHNRRAGSGEIDLLARDGDMLVFIEVRMRRSTAWVKAGASISADKRRRLRDAARRLSRREDLRWPRRSLRFDVVVLADDGARLVVEHLISVRI